VRSRTRGADAATAAGSGTEQGRCYYPPNPSAGCDLPNIIEALSDTHSALAVTGVQTTASLTPHTVYRQHPFAVHSIHSCDESNFQDSADLFPYRMLSMPR
jgi:hypothetical protein